MVVNVDRPGIQEANPQPNSKSKQYEAPYLGRSVRVVGRIESVDALETPHEKNRRGELGPALFNYRVNSVGMDPFGRMATGNTAADPRNVMQVIMDRVTKGDVSPIKVEVRDPRVMARHLKRVARFLGADVVGITRTFPGFLYTAGRYPDNGTGTMRGEDNANPTPYELADKYPYAITCALAWNYDMGKAHRHHIGDVTYHLSTDEVQILMKNIAAYIRELGYNAIQRVAQPMPVALAAGIGEHARNGMLITEKFGARGQLGDIIITDLPLVPDMPIDIGVTDFCRSCNKCAVTCPTNSITTEGKAVVNGVEKFKINWETCYRLRPFVKEFWSTCMTCVTVCPYTKPNTWWHFLAMQSIKRTPKPLRIVVIKPLKWLDNLVWGKVPRKRIRWGPYDSGVLPVLKAQDGRPGATDEGELAPEKGNMGYYYPLKENTRRFEILKERARQSKKRLVRPSSGR